MRARPWIMAPMLFLTLAPSCGGGDRRAEAPLESSCRVQLPPSPPRAPLVHGRMRGFAPPRSTIIVNAEVPLAPVKQGLESKVPQRVAEERDHDIGLAGRLEYTVDRGPFAVSVDGDALVVETPLVAHARACAKGSCYAGCDPEAKATARVPLQLGADYKFRPSSVRIDVTRGCELRALGGMVRVDLTPVLQQRLAQEAPRIATSIDHELPDLRPEAARIWGELGKARPLAFGSCAVLAPEAVAQGPSSGAADLARLRFAVTASPEVRVRCGDAPPRTAPLPPLRSDDAMPPDGEVHLAVVLPADAPSIALAGSSDIIHLGPARARIARAAGSTSDLSVGLAGEACGDVELRAAGAAWTADGAALHLSGVAPIPGEAERLSAAGFDGSALVAAVERAPISVALSADTLKAALPDLAGALSDDRVAVAATVADARPEIAGLRGDQPIAVVRVRGAVTLRAK